MDISIIIVNYKSKDKLKACLASIKQSDLSSIEYEVIVVENASGDDLSDLKENFELVQSDINLGMGSGNNLGIQRAKGDFLLILNPDTILKRDAIKILFNSAKKDKDVAIIGPKLLNPDSSLQLSCAYFPRPWTPIFRRTFLSLFFERHLNWFLMKNFSHDTIREVDWLMGSCLMIKREGFAGFDERFFMYFEDIDVCRQAWKSGKKVVYNPEAEVFHLHARESARNPWYISIFKNKLAQEHVKSWYRYFRKWGFKK
jgi:N-acetylglucosaminyl-diphospho-decaprenol L-rhamnosyltransferase